MTTHTVVRVRINEKTKEDATAVLATMGLNQVLFVCYSRVLHKRKLYPLNRLSQIKKPLLR